MEENKIKEKLAKVLALAESPIKAEAEAALKTFRRLLIKYSLTEADIEKENQERNITKKGYYSGSRRPLWITIEVMGVTSFCGCVSVREGQVKRANVRRTFFYKYFFAGFEVGVVSALTLFDYIVGHAVAESARYAGRSKRDFLKSFAVAIEARLKVLKYEKDYAKADCYQALVVSNIKQIEKQ